MALFACFVSVSRLSALNIASQPYSVSSEAITNPGQANALIRVIPATAFIMIDGSYVGTSPWSGTMTPGTHVISVSAGDHYPTQFLFSVLENTKYTIDIRLEPYTGFLSIETFPSDAAVYIDGNKARDTLLELPIGNHTVLVKKFGFDEKSSRILILRNRTSTVNVSLPRSVFAITNFRVRPDAFNPTNKGLYDRASISFAVSAPGYGSIEIVDPDGSSIYRKELPVFKTWAQHFTWSGLDSRGTSLPDNEYKVTLLLWPQTQDEYNQDQPGGLKPSEASAVPGYSAEPETGVAKYTLETALSFTAKIRIDSSRKFVPLGTSAARPGLLYFPDPKVGELLPGSAEALVAINGGASVSLGFRIDDATMLAIEGLYDISSGGGVAGSLLRSVGKLSGFDMAIFARTAWTSSLSPSFPGSGSEAELSVPLAIGRGALRAGVSPGIVYDMTGGVFKPRIAAAFWLETQGLVAGLSAMASFGPGVFPSPANSLLLAAETRVLLDNAPFMMLFRISGALEPALVSPAASFGFGIAW